MVALHEDFFRVRSEFDILIAYNFLKDNHCETVDDPVRIGYSSVRVKYLETLQNIPVILEQVIHWRNDIIKSKANPLCTGEEARKRGNPTWL